MAYRVILAHDNNYGIGLEGRLPWACPDDLAYFKKVTCARGRNLVCAKVTYDSLPEAVKARVKVVVSTKFLDLPDIEVYGNMTPEMLNRLSRNFGDLWVIGGTTLFTSKIMLGAVSVHVSTIKGTFKVDKRVRMNNIECLPYKIHSQTSVLKITIYYPNCGDVDGAIEEYL